MKTNYYLNRTVVTLLAVLLFNATSAPALYAAQGIVCGIQNSACTVQTTDGMLIHFDIQPKPVVVMRERTFIVTLTRHGNAVDDAGVSLDLSMPGMYMGKNTPVMKRVATGRYEGTGVIMRCPSGKKIWRATVSVKSNIKTEAHFVFEVQ